MTYHVVSLETEPAGDSTILRGVTRPGIDVKKVTQDIKSDRIPNGATVRSLQAADEPSRYNLQGFPTFGKHAEKITYEREEVTMSEAKGNSNLRGSITSDDEYDLDDDDVVFIRHTWSIPSGLTQPR